MTMSESEMVEALSPPSLLPLPLVDVWCTYTHRLTLSLTAATRTMRHAAPRTPRHPATPTAVNHTTLQYGYFCRRSASGRYFVFSSKWLRVRTLVRDRVLLAVVQFIAIGAPRLHIAYYGQLGSGMGL